MAGRGLWSTLGPGVLLAAASIGTSHLVFSPQAGSLFGYQLLWLVVISHIFKYPAFEFGPRYAAATGNHLLHGYARVPGPKNWALIVFLIGTLVQGIGVLAAVVSVAGSVLSSWTNWLGAVPVSLTLIIVIVFLLLAGGFSWLDHLNKIMMATLAIATALAFVRILPEVPVAEAGYHLVIPTVPAGSIVLVAAILSWMPTGIDVSVWHSFWTIEKMKTLDASGLDNATQTTVQRLKTALLDMRIGYALSLCTGLMFVTMGAVHLAGQGADLKSVRFAEALSTAYTAYFGRWMYHVFMLTAFFAMFSTAYTVIDGFSRSFAECCATLRTSMSKVEWRLRLYRAFVIGSSVLAGIILVTVGNPVTIAKSAALISLATAPLLYAFNLYCVHRHIQDPKLRPSALSMGTALVGIVAMTVALGVAVYLKFA